MITILTRIIIFIAWAILQASNPIKTRFLIITLVGLILINLRIETRSAWFTMLFIMLFAGGILIMFMILSSILPNEKSGKTKFPKSTSVLILILILITRPKQTENLGEMSQAKRFLSSRVNLIIILAIIILYFFKSIKLNGTENLSIRSLYC